MKAEPAPPRALAEAAAVAAASPEVWELRLYIAGRMARSVAAVQNLTRLFDEHLSGRHRIEVHPGPAGMRRIDRIEE